ncbi:MAG: 3-phosphoshikimate 1-carboxyvinyltransferase [Piscirickettsiaceae bacterium CG_4_9_14_3_um_filter_43_564]|nr:3-phosphoshikimate 1-carboxyvinyltransferase [Thiomicrospira sp.]OIP95957.1 MAG: 3-phosphoshikimate 1-carboxyvinyltransferase [Thiomicrospira sp. CG2_30_44_34]PIQ03999.1 MAG: 3-phosphoshikimate 1-carboxyvinyltransferase [Piscirickettsiaceae bacterium CG18_big_fil_WC_8_21_14_2_50_44_103]PIU39318.1 MAG: 3-phosphoshikimate 1-carboxyvinyltransferase [Piscirickettsiaceae bacterium CG07_land_8_20_14_0_80_44_28]PIW56943.1 MAG: 3-phosphoshikimate 1-carboxyvinyltransferase [Piscirickettsiaceae bacter
MSKNIQFIVKPGGSIKGRIRVPGDKSISHRSIMLGSIAEGTTHVTGFLEGDDSLATLKVFQAMGVNIEGPTDGAVTIHGVGLKGLKAPHKPLDMGNSGTTMRLLAGILAGQDFECELIGDASLSKRPMQRVTLPLTEMGAQIKTAAGGKPPLHLMSRQGQPPLKAIHYKLPMASAQVKSCILLAGLYADGQTSVIEPAPTRDHTERMLRGFGYPVTSTQLDQAKTHVKLKGGGRLQAMDIDVPSDISSAAFFMVAAAIAKEADLVIEHVGINPTRTGVIDILKRMGADITFENESEVGGEPVADIHIRSSKLKGIEIPESLVPLAIDEFPVLFVAASAAEGQTVLTGAEELRVKESDRIQVMAEGLQAIGVDATPTADGMIINGGVQSPQTSPILSHHDHRISMAMAIAGLNAAAEITIDDCANVNTSFPTFLALANEVGLKIKAYQKN